MIKKSRTAPVKVLMATNEREPKWCFGFDIRYLFTRLESVMAEYQTTRDSVMRIRLDSETLSITPMVVVMLGWRNFTNKFQQQQCCFCPLVGGERPTRLNFHVGVNDEWGLFALQPSSPLSIVVVAVEVVGVRLVVVVGGGVMDCCCCCWRVVACGVCVVCVMCAGDECRRDEAHQANTTTTTFPTTELN